MDCWELAEVARLSVVFFQVFFEAIEYRSGRAFQIVHTYFCNSLIPLCLYLRLSGGVNLVSRRDLI